MAEHAAGSRWTSKAGWLAAFVAVPAALAGLSLSWPGPRLADDLQVRSAGALAAAGLPGVTVTVSGRDAALLGVPPGAEGAATGAVLAVPGIRDVQVDAYAPAPPPSAPADAGPADARRLLAGQLAEVLTAAPITFPADSADLTGPAADTVRRVAGLLAAEPAVRVGVDGHAADTPGPADVAQRLSELRAAAVAEALVAAGVDPARIDARGRGAEQPLATPAASRRVEIIVG